MKEFDVLFEAFFASESSTIEQGGWPQLETLLAQEDDLLFDWVSGREVPPDPALLFLINRLRKVS